VADAGPGQPWSHNTPGCVDPTTIPQLVSITFDDNFGLEAIPAGTDPSTEGVNWIVKQWGMLKNPSANPPNPDNFDGTPVHATFYYTSIYATDPGTMVKTSTGSYPGGDTNHANHNGWAAAFKAGHEAANHTVNHFNGGPVPLGPMTGEMARDWAAADWASELTQCNALLTNPSATVGIGAKAADVVGFRAPYLGYNDAMYTALQMNGFTYDTSIPNCFDDGEDGTNCAWPYTLDNGSPDQQVLAKKFTNTYGGIKWSFPQIAPHPGLWEMPPSALIIPDDSQATTYNFKPGLRTRIPQFSTGDAIQPGTPGLAYPDIYDQSSNKIAGLDYSMLNDAQITPDEMRAILEYNLDQHLNGNRSPFIFIAHSFDYSNEGTDDFNTPSIPIRDDRQKALLAFVQYALSKPEVRIVNVKDILAWVKRVSGK
jgi:peptidoglycan/xylan/chitin deacetylase (PgdA/CDA1 family)